MCGCREASAARRLDAQAYSREHEARLLPGWGTGKRWTNPSAARFLGEPNVPGDFTGVGAPRWRQRAFYDALKDALAGRRLAASRCTTSSRRRPR